MNNSNSPLIVTAHPDDESIFFAGLILSRPKASWRVACVTDGNADGEGERRKKQIELACETLGVQDLQFLNFPDAFSKRLNVHQLINRLSDFDASEVFTHEVLGEYGHPHHQDVSYATHQALGGKAEVWSVAHNVFPEIKVELSKSHWDLKFKVIRDVYFSESKRFIQFLPTTPIEGFVKVSTEVNQAIYHFLTNESAEAPEQLGPYEELRNYLSEVRQAKPRPF